MTEQPGRRSPFPSLGLVVLVGVSGSGKSTFARTHFKPTQVLSSDACRGLVADDENDQSATADAFDVAALHRRHAAARAVGSPWSTPPTCSRTRARVAGRSWPASTTCCRSRSCSTCPSALCWERNAARPDRDFGRARGHRASTATCARSLRRPRRARASARSTSCADRRRSTRHDRPTSGCSTTGRDLTGPFDIIGDVHGCRAELRDPADRARLRARA